MTILHVKNQRSVLGKMADFKQHTIGQVSVLVLFVCVSLSLPVSDSQPPSLARSLSLAHEHTEDVSASLLPSRAAVQM